MDTKRTADDRFARFKEHLRSQRLKSTEQRDTIVKAFLNSQRHISVEELYNEVRRLHPHIGYATVYRTMKLLTECGLTVDDVDLYIPHQANKRIIDHAAAKLGIPEEKVFVNVDRYGNTSSASIPLCLAQGVREGRLEQGTRVLMTGMGAGLTWGSAYTVWGNGTP